MVAQFRKAWLPGGGLAGREYDTLRLAQKDHKNKQQGRLPIQVFNR
jgi:hypothetical protein